MREKLSNLIRNKFRRDEIFLCVSPTYNNIKLRNSEFISSISGEDVELETLLEPIEKVFTKQTDGCDVKMTGVAVRIQNKNEQQFIAMKIKNKRILRDLNSRRDSTTAQRELVRSIAIHFTEAECDILYRPNLMGDCPDMLLLKSGHKAKLIYTCDVADPINCVTDIKRVSHIADSVKKRLNNLLSRGLIEASNIAFGLVQCVIFMPKINIKEGELKKLIIAEISKDNKEENKLFEKELKYLELFTSESKWQWQNTPNMTDAIYMELKDIHLPKISAAKKNKIIFKQGTKQANLAISVAGERKKVFGVFGSGKTTVMVARAISAFKRTHKMVVILLFRLSRNWTFRPLDLVVSQLPLNA